MKTIAVFPNKEKYQAVEVVDRLVKYAENKPINLVMTRDLADRFKHPELGIDNVHEAPLDLGITIGGDGTLLGFCRDFYNKGKHIPACGINIGTVGFLTDIEPDEIERKMDQYLEEKYRIVERNVLHGSVISGGTKMLLSHAMNDVVITKGGVARMLHLGLSIGGYRVGDFKADGMILSTALGSTAYSLSAGGPIVHPAVKAILITPICPHSFNARPMVVSDTESISVHIAAVHQDIQVVFDGQENFSLQPGDEVVVRKAMNPARIVKFEDKNYFATLNNKLWGSI